eukprot:8446754-Alexandrium_andersonii.AAC.1
MHRPLGMLGSVAVCCGRSPVVKTIASLNNPFAARWASDWLEWQLQIIDTAARAQSPQIVCGRASR